MTVLEIDTAEGLARTQLHVAADPAGALVLGHGAAGGFGAPDLVAVIGVAREAGWTVAAVEQPYRVAGRRTPPRAERLDAAWTAVVERLREGQLQDLPLVAGGRSSGARVACRTAAQTGAVAVLCLAFPVHAPGRASTATSRQPELDAVPVPTLVVQGDADPFGMPASGPGRTVVVVPGNHSLKAGLEPMAAAVRDWLAQLSGS
jgi:predicted alpha/beta-hydrolase family hydrolase